jgi:pimeloyl-ACP methyl ester carboxylesterase
VLDQRGFEVTGRSDVIDLFADIRGSGPPVVLLHGQPGSSADWAAVTTRLEDRFTVVIPDRPGYGQTAGQARGFRDNADAVGSLLDRLDIRRATIAGHSWSGGVAIAMAERAPHRVVGLVLVASVSPLEPLGPLDRALAIAPVGAMVAASLNLTGRVLSLRPVRQLLAPRLLGASDDAVIALASAWRRADIGRSFLIEQRSLADELPRLAAGLGDIAAPADVLVGEADRIVPAHAGARLAAALPRGRLIRLPGAGHLLPRQQPDAIVAAIDEITSSA